MSVIRKPRRYLLFNLSVYDAWTDEERALYHSYKKGKKGEQGTLKKLYDEKLNSYKGIRKIDHTKMFQTDGNIRLDRTIAAFENEAVRLCESFINFDFDNSKKVPIVKEFIILDCGNEMILNQIVDRGIEIDGVKYFVYII